MNRISDNRRELLASISRRGGFALLPIAMACYTNPAWSYDFHGYFRAGITAADNGETIEYRVNDLGRYGNETTGWYTLFWENDVFEEDDKRAHVVASLEGNTQLYTAFEPIGTSRTTDQPPNTNAITNLYADVIGFIPGHPEAHLWVGKRNYDKKELQMMDYKYVAIGGPGVGVDHLNMGPGTLAMNWIRVDSNTAELNSPRTSTSDNINVNFLDARYKLPVFSKSSLDLIGDYAIVNKTGSQELDESSDAAYTAHNSLMLTSIYTTPFRNGFNETVFQYADKGLAPNMTGLGIDLLANSDYSNAKGFRFINSGEFYPTDHTIVAHALTYAEANNLSSDASTRAESEKLFSVAVRPGYLWDEHNRSTFEIAWFNRQNDYLDGTSASVSGQKFTLAQVISAGTSMLTVRPEIRFYATYINADDELPFNDSTEGSQFSFGAQVEAWW
ncbi:carbohydrate porin [Marinobacterium sedimentorum]|uniref:carbohydrate porin n=1 Tax=Marinobacterium sedimentorum TaxID=2927804 RepID=UPI0020C6CBE7|nr:carbohydrate porin [Marinobacterium sedimentorum]MCP8688706.1 carbohydrate porin [Marinobacterium sedimentorum]